MFANLTYEDKEAFFSLLDEYFASRPQHLASSSSSPVHVTSPTRSVPPSRSPAPHSPPPSASPYASFISASSASSVALPAADTQNMSRAEKDAAKQQAKEQQRMDLVSRLAIHSIKASTSTARTSLGLVAGNKRAMAALRDIPGAQGLVKGADGVLNPGKARNQKPQQQQQQEQQYSEVQGKKSPPPPPEKKMGGGLSGFSGKSFGHMTSMFKDTPKAAGSASSPTIRQVDTVAITTVEPDVQEAEGQAQVLYDYEGSVRNLHQSGDLGVQNGQIVNVIEKSSADWWTCEDGNGLRGLVPANYLKEI